MSFPLVSFKELTKYVLLNLNSQTARKTSECDAKICFLNKKKCSFKVSTVYIFQLQDKLNETGVSGVTLKWREQPDGEVFHKEGRNSQKEKKKTELWNWKPIFTSAYLQHIVVV